jgi:predicted DNA-binding transcriptional regulator YafY
VSRSEERTFNRTERLFALILLLQNRPNLSARNLAEHFGVTRRTIFRDLRALSESGVPLTYAEGGGYEILEGYQLPPLMLSAREAATLLIGAAFVKLQPDASLQEDADQVALKIRSVLPGEIREYIDRLQASTVLDPFWQHAVAPGDAAEGRWYELSEALARRRRVLMEYLTAARGEVTRRTVDPLGLVYYSDHWNLIAYDHLRTDVRNFRLDRIQTMRVLMERFEPPRDFDLAAFLAEKGTSPRNVDVRIRFEAKTYDWARRSIPANVREEVRSDEGVEVGFRFENMDYLAKWLIRFGTSAHVLEPSELRERVGDLARQVADQYRA